LRNQFCCAAILLLASGTGCSSKSDPIESRIAFFKTNRGSFESYISRIEQGGIKSTDQGYEIPQLFAENGIKRVVRHGDCVEITFVSMSVSPVPLLIYSPSGIQGVSPEYRDGGPLGSRKWSYWRFIAIDDKWFYCEWDL
jgi:hypothetical protein